MGHLVITNNQSQIDSVMTNRLRRSLWRDIFFSFYVVYKKAKIFGTIIFGICMISLYVQTEFPYQYEKEEMEQEEVFKEKVQHESTHSIKKNSSKSTAVLTKSDFQYKYKNYKVAYKGKKGVKKKKAEKLLEQYMYCEWNNDITVSKKVIKLPYFLTAAKYKVVHVRKINSKTILVYIKITSGENKGSNVKINVQNVGEGMYQMSYT